MGWPSSGYEFFRIRSRVTELPSTCYATVIVEEQVKNAYFNIWNISKQGNTPYKENLIEEEQVKNAYTNIRNISKQQGNTQGRETVIHEFH